MYILVSNDDGIRAKGLAVLCQELSKKFKVVVVAPDRERSATGHGITVHKPLRVNKLDMPDSPVKGWSVTGTPADCIKIAMDELLEHRPDLVVAGINRGENLATDVLYSGTVSAAIEGVISGVPAIAVSLLGEKEHDFTYAARFTFNLISLLQNQGFHSKMLLNINVPNVDVEDIRGVEITRLGLRQYTNVVHDRVDPRGRTYYWLAGEVQERVDEEGTDVWAVAQNKVSITPIQLDLTDYRFLRKLKMWV